jgi:hypothetical protein
VLTRTTVIGIGIGGVISAIAIYALITSIGLQTITATETVSVGKSTAYQFDAPKSSHQNFKVTGEKFHIKLQTPGDGIQKDEDFKNEITFDWFVLQEGKNKIDIQNLGPTDLTVNVKFSRYTEAILITYHIMVLTAGVVIIGFSAAFSVRRPKGF